MKMHGKLKYFANIALIAILAASAIAKALDDVVQGKSIRIVDLQGDLKDLNINATYKEIKTMSIASKSDGSRLFADLIETSLMQSRPTAGGDLHLQEAIDRLNEQIRSLNASLVELTNASSNGCTSNTETSVESQCSTQEGVDNVQPIVVPGIEPFEALCDGSTGWQVIQRRFNGSVDFFKSWKEYRDGFGQINGEFFIGLERLHHLTISRPHELLIKLTTFQNSHYYARYGHFLLGNEMEKYPLHSLGEYSGNAGDSLTYNLHNRFSTYDSDNDNWPNGNCAQYYGSGWWFGWDVNSNLNGKYFDNSYSSYHSIWWYKLSGYKSLKSVEMLIRPKYTLL